MNSDVIHEINAQLQEKPINSEILYKLDLSFIIQGDSIIIFLDLDDKKVESIKNLEILNKLIIDYKKIVPIFLLLTKVDSPNKNQISKNYCLIQKWENI